MSVSFDAEKIKERLIERGAILPCPRCQNRDFSLVDGFFFHGLQKELSGTFNLGGSVIPVCATICTKCGFVSEHALGSLGLLDSAAGEGAK